MDQVGLIAFGAALAIIGSIVTGWIQHRRDEDRWQRSEAIRRHDAETDALVAYITAMTRAMMAADNLHLGHITWSDRDAAMGEMTRSQTTVELLVRNVEIDGAVGELFDRMNVLLGFREGQDRPGFLAEWERMNGMLERLTEMSRAYLGAGSPAA